jgi:hypothetical protein
MAGCVTKHANTADNGDNIKVLITELNSTEICESLLYLTNQKPHSHSLERYLLLISFVVIKLVSLLWLRLLVTLGKISLLRSDQLDRFFIMCHSKRQ